MLNSEWSMINKLTNIYHHPQNYIFNYYIFKFFYQLNPEA